MNLGIEINQDAEAKTTEEDLPAEAEIGRNDSNGEELHVSHVSALVYEADSGRNGSNGEYDWSDEIESVDSEPIQNEEEQNEIIAETNETNGGDLKERAVGEIQTIETYGGDQDDQEEEAVLGVIQMDRGGVNDEEL
jgi:hypothetical protein